MASNTRYGRDKELQVAEFLERRRYAWKRSAGSRGPFDLVANNGSWFLVIQVKATRALSISTSRLSKDEEAQLLMAAEHNNAIAVLALVSRNYVWLLRVPDGLVLLEGKLTSLKYHYLDEK